MAPGPAVGRHWSKCRGRWLFVLRLLVAEQGWFVGRHEWELNELAQRTGFGGRCSGSSCHLQCQCPLLMECWYSLLSIQLPVNVTGKVADNVLRTWTSATHMGDSEFWAPGFLSHQWMGDSLSLLCHSAIQINTP